MLAPTAVLRSEVPCCRCVFEACLPACLSNLLSHLKWELLYTLVCTPTVGYIQVGGTGVCVCVILGTSIYVGQGCPGRLLVRLRQVRNLPQMVPVASRFSFLAGAVSGRFNVDAECE